MKRIPRSLANSAAGAALVALSVIGASPAQALPITWNFSGTFDEGSTANGPFSIGFYGYLGSPLSVVTTTGPNIGGYTYTMSDPVFNVDYPTDRIIEFSHADYHGFMHLEFLNPLTSPGTDPLILALSYECDGYENYIGTVGYCPSSANIRYFKNGAATTASAAPEPATLVLFGAGLAGLGAMRRRRKGKA